MSNSPLFMKIHISFDSREMQIIIYNKIKESTSISVRRKKRADLKIKTSISFIYNK